VSEDWLAASLTLQAGTSLALPMRFLYSYLRIIMASVFFMAGIALQFVPSAAGAERDVRFRERQLEAVPADQRAQWLLDRDADDARSEAYLRVFGVLVGGIGLGGALLEAAYLCAQYCRSGPWDPA
jgi:hypothetical protein